VPDGFVLSGLDWTWHCFLAGVRRVKVSENNGFLYSRTTSNSIRENGLYGLWSLR